LGFIDSWGYRQMSGSDAAREKMPNGSGRSPGYSGFQAPPSETWLALQLPGTCPHVEVAEHALALAFKSRRFVLSGKSRAG